MPQERERAFGLAWGCVVRSRGMFKPQPQDCLRGSRFICPTQQPAISVVGGINKSITSCRISIPSTGGFADTWVPVPIVREKRTAPRCRCVKHRSGLAAPSIAPALLSPPLPLPWDLLQPSSSSSSWDMLPSPGAAPQQTPCHCLAVLYVHPSSTAHPLHCQLSPPWAKSK